MSLEVINGKGFLTCDVCGAKAASNSKEFNRFIKRHPAKCSERREFSKQLAEGVRSVESIVDTVINEQWVGDDNAKPRAYDPMIKPVTRPEKVHKKRGGMASLATEDCI